MGKSKAPLHKHIDDLSQELNLTEPQYTDKTSIKELEDIIDQLESQLPDDDSDVDEHSDPQDPEAQADPNDSEVQGSSQSDSSETDNSDVLITGTDELPDGAVIDEDNSIEVKGNDNGDLQVQALSTFRCRVNGSPVQFSVGDREYLPEDVAMDAIEAGVAALIGVTE